MTRIHNSHNDELQALGKIKTYKFKRYVPQKCIEKLSFAIIRPPRFVYNQAILNPYKKYRNHYKYSVHNLSFPLSLYQPQNMAYIVLYLHGNSSSRYQGFMRLSDLPLDVGLACFDFNGCGLRTQKRYISLGKNESEEVDQAARYLKEMGHKVVGWGRSMGAVSLLLSKQLSIIVADSPFSSLYKVCEQITYDQTPCCLIPIFHCVFPCIFCAVSRDIQSKLSIHPNALQIIDQINHKKDRKIVFLAGKDDQMVKYTHSKRLYDAFQGQKKIFIFDGDHNSARPTQVLLETFMYIQSQMLTPSIMNLQKQPEIINVGQNKYSLQNQLVQQISMKIQSSQIVLEENKILIKKIDSLDSQQSIAMMLNFQSNKQ